MTDPRSWMEFVREDARMAELALAGEIYNQACFHAQQGDEKALKAFLQRHHRAVPRSHALRELLAQCRQLDEEIDALKEACARLDRYYIPTRYPEALPGMAPEGLPTRQDAEEAVAFLRQALDWIERKIE